MGYRFPTGLLRHSIERISGFVICGVQDPIIEVEKQFDLILPFQLRKFGNGFFAKMQIDRMQNMVMICRIKKLENG